MDGGAWWAAAYGVAQNWTRLKRLSSSSSKQGLTWQALRIPQQEVNHTIGKQRKENARFLGSKP